VELLKAIADAWGWKGIDPAEIVDQNAFGNMIIRTTAGSYWRICPEELDARCIADSRDSFEKMRANPEFALDWEMERLVQQANNALGRPGPGRCYCLKISAVLGGGYDSANIGTIDLIELLASSGDLARQIDGMPDGSKIQLTVK
jgi:Domain of unknown function (DUF1851)